MPDPPEPFAPLFETWTAGQELYRVHKVAVDRAANTFNPRFGHRTRFAFFGDPPVPVLYAGQSTEAAVAESLLHDLGDLDGLLSPAHYLEYMVSRLSPARDLKLVRLHSDGLIRLGVEPFQLTDTDASHYPRTVRWAAATHDQTDADGLVWMSRRWNTERAVVLFGDRVREQDLVELLPPVHVFRTYPSFAWLEGLCGPLGITVEPPADGLDALSTAISALLVPRGQVRRPRGNPEP